MTAARIRDLYGEYHDAEIVTEVDQPGITCVRVPGFGHLFLSNLPGAPAKALLAQGPGRGEVWREVVETDGRYEIELLPNSSGEDRIVVVVEP